MNNYGSLRQAPTLIGQPKSRNRVVRKMVILGFGVAGLFLIAVVAISIYVGWQLTHPEKKPVDDSPANYGLTYTELELKSRLDQISLSGWKIESTLPAKGVIVFAHGYRNNRLQDSVPALSLASDLVAAGYHVYMFDFRGSGLSEGSLTTIGYQEREDLITVVLAAQEEYPDLGVGVVGFSMGAATAIVAASEESTIKAVVADSPFANLEEYLGDNLSYWSNLPNFPFTPVILTLLPSYFNIDLEQVNPREAIKQSETPHLLIHGDSDLAISYQQSVEIVEQRADQHNVSLWIAKGADHVNGYAQDPEQYKRRVIQFFDQYLFAK